MRVPGGMGPEKEGRDSNLSQMLERFFRLGEAATLISILWKR